MKIDDPEQKEVVAVKKEKKDDDDGSEPSTVAAGNEEIPSASRPLPPVHPTGAKNEPEEVPRLILPKPDGERAEKKRRTDRSASSTPDAGKEEERVAEKERQERIDKEGEAIAEMERQDKTQRTNEDADHRGCGEMQTFTNSMYEELIMETQMFNEKYGGRKTPFLQTNKKILFSEAEGKKVV